MADLPAQPEGFPIGRRNGPVRRRPVHLKHHDEEDRRHGRHQRRAARRPAERRPAPAQLEGDERVGKECCDQHDPGQIPAAIKLLHHEVVVALAPEFGADLKHMRACRHQRQRGQQQGEEGGGSAHGRLSTRAERMQPPMVRRRPAAEPFPGVSQLSAHRTSLGGAQARDAAHAALRGPPHVRHLAVLSLTSSSLLGLSGPSRAPRSWPWMRRPSRGATREEPGPTGTVKRP
jgi:hypothetical protein